MANPINDRMLHPGDPLPKSSKVTEVDAGNLQPTVRVFYSDLDGTKPIYRWEMDYSNGSTSEHPDIIVRKCIDGVWEEIPVS